MQHTTPTYNVYKIIYRLMNEHNYSLWLKVYEENTIVSIINRKLNHQQFLDSEKPLVYRFLELYSSFKDIQQLFDLFDNPTSYPNRLEFVNYLRCKGKLNYDFFVKILPFEYKKLVELLDKDIDTNIESIDEEQFRKFVKLLRSNLTQEELFIRLHDELGIKPDYFDKIADLYLRTVLTNNNTSIINNFNYQQTLKLKDLSKAYHDYLYQNSHHDELELNIDEVNEINVLSTELKTILNESTLSFLIEFLINKGYTYDRLVELRDELNKLWYAYLDREVKLNVEIDRSNIKLSDRKEQQETFKKVLELYNYIISSSYLADIICSDREDKEKIINLSYRAKYFNAIKPITVDYSFDMVHIRRLDDESKEKIEQYRKEYREYYMARKEQENLEKQGEKTKKAIEKYAGYIRGFLEAKPDNVHTYINSTHISSYEFYKGVSILKECNHTLYNEYEHYCKTILKGYDCSLAERASEVIDKMVYGVEENETVRPFDLVDFYASISMTPLQFVRYVSKNMPGSASIASSFQAKYKNDCPIGELSLEKKLQKEVSYKKYDKDGNLIYEYIATPQDKEKVVSLLRKYNIPITEYTYNILLRRFVFTRYQLDKEIDDLKTKIKVIGE